MNDDEQQMERTRREKVESFRIHSAGGEPNEGRGNNLYSGGEIPRASLGGPSINSYSDPRRARRAEVGAQAVGEAMERSRKAHKRRNKEKGRGNRHFFRLIWLMMVLLISLLLAQYISSGLSDMLATNRSAVNVTVEIPQRATPNQVSDILYKAGVIQNVDFFRLYEKLTKAPKTFDGGTYQIKTDMDYEAILNSLQSSKNRVDTVKLTFHEGEDALEMAADMEKNGVCSAKAALAAFNSSSLDDSFEMLQKINNASRRYYRLEGYLFPDTYEFFKNEDPAQAVKKLVSNCNTKLTKQIRSKAAEKGMTLDQMLTLASMIQAEAADKNDMYLVSSVFHNRLASKSAELRKLSSDPTIFYPYRRQSAVPVSIRKTYKSRYDTYTIEGLPPGPICNPGMDAVDAALNPASTNYYYFCHDDKGKAYYARTSAQHQVNLKKAGLR